MINVPNTNQDNAHNKSKIKYFENILDASYSEKLAYSAGFRAGANFGRKSTLTKLGYREYRDALNRDLLKKEGAE